MKLRSYLRSKIYYYFNPLVKKNKCENCGSIEDLEVHHEYEFSKMLDDVLNELNLDLKDVEDYTEKELLNITEKILGKHLYYNYKTLCKECHMLITAKQNERHLNQDRKIKDINKFTIELDEKWLNKPLTTEDKNALYEELNLYNEKWRLLRWPSIKRILINSGYIIKSCKPTINGKPVNCHMISKII